METAKAAIIDMQTGKQLGFINEGDRVVKKKSLDYLNMTIEINTDEPFVKVFTRKMFKLSKVLSGPEMMFVNYMMQYIRYESGLLAHENGKRLDKRYIANEIGKSVRWVEQVLKTLEEKEVLSKSKLKYFVNPFLFMRGQRISKTLYEMFENSKWFDK